MMAKNSDAHEEIREILAHRMSLSVGGSVPCFCGRGRDHGAAEHVPGLVGGSATIPGMTSQPRNRPDAAPADAPAAPVPFSVAYPDAHGVLLDLIEMTVRGSYPATADSMRAAIDPAFDPADIPETPAP
jgi:hypothetical protein